MSKKTVEENKADFVEKVVKKRAKKNEDIPDKILRTATRPEDIVVLTSKGKTFRVTPTGEVFFEKVDFAAIDKQFQAYKKKEMDSILAEAARIIEKDPKLAKQVAKETGVVLKKGKASKKK
jgi:hypothetical protein